MLTGNFCDCVTFFNYQSNQNMQLIKLLKSFHNDSKCSGLKQINNNFDRDDNAIYKFFLYEKFDVIKVFLRQRIHKEVFLNGWSTR